MIVEMTKPVKLLYKEALECKEFEDDLKRQDPKGYVKPKWYSREVDKILYTSAYYGWLLARNEYKYEKYR